MQSLTDLYQNVDVFLLIFSRVFFALIFLPIMTETQLPNVAKAGLSMILALLVYIGGDLPEITYNPTVMGFGILIFKEMLVGLIISYIMSIFFNVYLYVGFLLGIQGGLSMSILVDPASGEQVSSIGKFYSLSFSVLFLISGGYHWFIKSLLEAFTYIPIGAAVFNPNMAFLVTNLVAVFFEVGFKLASPILGVMFIIDCGLGILARTVPQMNMFVIGIPLKMIILFLMLIIILPLFPSYNNVIIENMKEALTGIIQGLIPS